MTCDRRKVCDVTSGFLSMPIKLHMPLVVDLSYTLLRSFQQFVEKTCVHLFIFNLNGFMVLCFFVLYFSCAFLPTNYASIVDHLHKVGCVVWFAYMLCNNPLRKRLTTLLGEQCQAMLVSIYDIEYCTQYHKWEGCFPPCNTNFLIVNKYCWEMCCDIFCK